MARGLNHSELVGAESDYVAFLEGRGKGNSLHLETTAQDALNLKGEVGVEFGIAGADFGL